MNFRKERTIENRVFTTKTSFVSLGSATMTPEEEQRIFSSFGYPTIEVGGEFAGYYKLDVDKIVKTNSADPAAEEVKFVLNSKKVLVDNTFSTENKVNIDKTSEQFAGDRVRTAEAKCHLFEDVIEERITAAVTAIKAKATEFENGFPTEFTV